MAKITFEEYCEDMLDQHIALMSDEELAVAKAAFNSLNTKPSAKVVIKETVKQLTTELARLAAMQERSISFAEAKGLDVTPLSDFVELAKKALSVKTSKKDLVAAIEASREASRAMNAQA